jgi:hypothetical protein
MMTGDAWLVTFLGALCFLVACVSLGYELNFLTQAGVFASGPVELLNGTVPGFRTSTFAGDAGAYGASFTMNGWRVALLVVDFSVSLAGALAMLFVWFTASTGCLAVAPALRAAVGYNRMHNLTVFPFTTRRAEYSEDFCVGWSRHHSTPCGALAFMVILIKTAMGLAVIAGAMAYSIIAINATARPQTPAIAWPNTYENPLFGAVAMSVVHMLDFDTLGTDTRYCMQRKTSWYLIFWALHLIAWTASVCGTVFLARSHNAGAACVLDIFDRDPAPACFTDFNCLTSVRRAPGALPAGTACGFGPQFTPVTYVSTIEDSVQFASLNSQLAVLQITLTALSGVSFTVQTFWCLQLWVTRKYSIWPSGEAHVSASRRRRPIPGRGHTLRA